MEGDQMKHKETTTIIKEMLPQQLTKATPEEVKALREKMNNNNNNDLTEREQQVLTVMRQQALQLTSVLLNPRRAYLEFCEDCGAEFPKQSLDWSKSTEVRVGVCERGWVYADFLPCPKCDSDTGIRNNATNKIK